MDYKLHYERFRLLRLYLHLKIIIIDFINSFSDDVILKIRSELRFLKEFGLSLMSTAKVKKISGTHNLYELRIKAYVQIRLFYILSSPDIFLILHGFVKKLIKPL
ncbi:type II toxin-antitoxin system RelE/ParE family toxin [Candidatus Roizmanbacteria bacterium]|nr:type II toxin-antitoxin system RelE/ParE family toxin [Candidatus Roizmanbacteria bacterium]